MGNSTKISSLLFLLFIALNSCEKPIEQQDFSERKVSFNKNWQFHLNDENQDTVTETAEWQKINLPHDWSIGGDFDENNPANHGGGYLPGGLGWYKKTFKVEDSTKLTSIVFDGVYMNSEVWINDHYLGKRPNGYISFEYDLTPYLNYGEKPNELLVKVDNSKQPNSRWYSGSGIYRNVWLKTTDKLHIAQWGTFVTTPLVTKDSATVVIQTTLKNEYPSEKRVTLITTLYNNNQAVNSSTEEITINQKTSKNTIQKITIADPDFWSIESPKLYKAITQLKIDNLVVDEYETPFGIRFFNFDLDKGFILNGQQVKIKGVCLHHDLGPLGTAISTRALERKLQIMKDMGVNAIRTSHNMPAPELLDLCDQMGLLVMDESFDMWHKTKTQFDYANEWDQWHQRDLEDFIKRDRNHPSVIVWSVGNEIQEQWEDLGVETTKELKAIVQNLDTTRPITVAMNPPVNMPQMDVTTQFDASKVYLNPIAASGELDLIGYNYAHQTYQYHKQNFPNTPFIATETTSGLQTRGYYEFPSDNIKVWPERWDIPFDGGSPDKTISAFDQVRVPWGSLHETTWKIIKKYNFLSGMFIWTGFDYIGEPTPYTWPARSSYFGVVDLAGFPKDVYYMYQSEWTDKDVLHVFPHWNWNEGQLVDVWAYYNNADEVELFVNGKSQGIKKKVNDDLHVMWRIPFEPGILKAVSQKDGKIVLEKEIKTAGEASGLNLIADRNTINANGKDMSFITVEVIDSDGNKVPTAQNDIHFELKGNGKIVGVASGDPTNHQSFKGTHHQALNGKCLVIVQSGEEAGELELLAKAEGLKSQTINIIMN